VTIAGSATNSAAHFEIPFQQVGDGRLHSNEEQSHSGQSDATPKDSAHGRNPPDSAVQSEPTAEKECAGKKEPAP
jgi:hypothetical protein